MVGYAVVDVETTGLRPSRHDRIVEIAVVHVDAAGRIEDTWSTLVNPERDLGPQTVHGIEAADIRHAPRFADIAGTVARLLDGRVFAAHNAPFDRRFLEHAYGACGYEVPLLAPASICTMRAAAALIPHAPRTLVGCCSHVGIDVGQAHEARADAVAAASLLGHLIDRGGASELAWWYEAAGHAARTPWPSIPVLEVEPVLRGVASLRDAPFLERLTDRLGGDPQPLQEQEYLALLDRALLDRHLSAREHDALAGLARELGIGRTRARELHEAYLHDLCAAAWADGILTEDEIADLDAVAGLLGLMRDDVERLLEDAAERVVAAADGEQRASDTLAADGRFALAPGDLVVFTGEMRRPRAEWEEEARRAGLVPHSGVTKKVALVVAADPDSLSGKARKAAGYGIPIVTEDAFAAMLR